VTRLASYWWSMTPRRRRNPFTGLLAHLGLLSSMAVLAGALLANGDGGGGDGGDGGGGDGGDGGGLGEGGAAIHPTI